MFNPVIDRALDQVAVVYGAHVTTGRYTVVVQAAMRCRLMHISLHGAQRSQDRAELAGVRHVIFDPDVFIDERSQIEVDGIRWAPMPGTFGTFSDWNGTPIYKQCDALRQAS